MLVYNVTVKIEHSVAEDWLDYMRNKHIADVLKTGCFSHARLTKMQHQEDDGATYAIQYTLPTQFALDEYMSKHAPALQKEHNDRYEGKYVSFRSVLEIIDEFSVKFT
jgi:hypothetical protein